MKFSLVCPIKDEVHLIPKTLPSFYKLNPAEVVLCLDNPEPPTVVDTVNEVAEAYNMEDKTRIIGVEHRDDYVYQQAWIRRKGFLSAEHDRILNTDIDLCLNKNVLKAVELVGKNDIGLASLSKAKPSNTFTNTYTRLLRYYTILRAKARFSGLYALWRPYWLDSEPEHKIKRFIGVKQVWRGEHNMYNGGAPRGEDSILNVYMKQKHRTVNLLDIGGTVLRENKEYLQWFQRVRGRYGRAKGESVRYAVLHALLRGEPAYLKGYLEVNKN